MLAALPAASLAAWTARQRWYAGPAVTGPAAVVAARPFTAAGDGVLATVRLGPTDDTYLLPLGVGHPAGLPAEALVAVIDGVAVYDALHDPRLVTALLTRAAPAVAAALGEAPAVRPLGVEQSNSSVVIDERYVLKVFRRQTAGPNRDLTVHRALVEAGCPNVKPLLGAVEDAASGTTHATLQEYLPDAVDGWALALEHARTFGDLRAEAGALGAAVAAVHRGLATAGGERPLTAADFGRLSEGFLARLDRALAVAPRLARHAARLRAEFRAVARPLWGPGPAAAAGGPAAQLIHGDLHLGQALRTGDDWLVIDFEGEPLATPAERDRPDSPLRDLAGMLRSFDYAAHHRAGDDRRGLARAARWAGHHQRAFLAGYAAAAGGAGRDAERWLLTAYVLDKAVYEVAYEVQHRPDWAWLPARALDRLLTGTAEAA
ncbi:hypothetical protein RM844_28970 [Streptomyces sp. DSM 44915]|uniref:Maltokinase n=1 Tax=Streptomyces chisholmiae TaxID=3075540 RepID=A0ABU2JZ84_9ACTN|nr:hypothetical protein [Streptomyces sp. DSM 44915]MDT0270311.1 hypothetical protein [Streptomyces sp. DSM 44915]